jgi:SAV_6107-like HEPN
MTGTPGSGSRTAGTAVTTTAADRAAAPRTAAPRAVTSRTAAARTSGRTPARRTVPVHAPVAATVLELVDRSRASLLAACRTSSVSERYVEAHLAALRAAAALMAARSRPTRRSRLRSVWEVLPEVAPELTEWAVFFAGTAQQRAALERGTWVPSAREADDLLRQSETFHGLIQSCLGLPLSYPLPELVAATGRP